MSFAFPFPRPAGPAPVLAPAQDSRRPRLLLSAARHGLALYRRDRDLPRLMLRMAGDPLDALTQAEARAESARRAGGAGYSFARHLDLMIALLAERRLAARA